MASFWNRHRLACSLLILQAVAILASYGLAGHEAVNHLPDSQSYLDFAWSYPNWLMQIRTPGYPALLWALGRVDPQLLSLPSLQLLAHEGVVLFFGWSLLSFGFSDGLALAAASPLLYAPAVLTTHANLLSDSLACSCSVMVIGCLLIAVQRPRQWRWWLCVAAAVFCTYQLRPAYLFLIPWVPLLALAVGSLRYTLAKRDLILKTILPRAFMAAVFPFVLYSGLRWVTVGQFGLVSFGGYNVVGIVSQFLNPTDLDLLPEAYRPLGRYIVKEQQERRLVRWNENGVRILTYDEIVHNYNTYILLCETFVDAQGMHSSIEKNNYFVRFSKTMLSIYRNAYRQWLMQAFLRVLGKFPDPEWILLLTLGLFLTFVARNALEPFHVGSDEERVQAQNAAIFLVIGAGHFLAQTLLVIMVEDPLKRYVDAAYLYLPSVLLCGMAVNLAIFRKFAKVT